jgi:hypothetical protein
MRRRSTVPAAEAVTPAGPPAASEHAQLTIDGREVGHPVPEVVRRHWPESWVQIVRHLNRFWLIRSGEAGVIVHSLRRERLNRQECSHGPGGLFYLYPEYPLGGYFVGCCRYAATDGWACLKRMADAGVVVNVGRGVWQLAAASDDVHERDLGIRCAVRPAPSESGHGLVRLPDVADESDGAGRGQT